MAPKILLLLALVAAPLALRGAGDGAIDRATLRGLKSINIVIDRLDQELENAGLAADVLRQRIEHKFQNAGIAVDSNSLEFLGVRVTPMRLKKGPYSVYFSVALYQPVYLSRDQKIRTATQTWESGRVLVVEPKRFLMAALDTMDQLVDEFVTAYRSVNPQ